MNYVEDFIKDIINDYPNCVIAGCVLLAVILLLIFFIKLSSIAKSQKNKNIILERIAKVIEQESEPYVIEKRYNNKPEKKNEKNSNSAPTANKSTAANKAQTANNASSTSKTPAANNTPVEKATKKEDI